MELLQHAIEIQRVKLITKEGHAFCGLGNYSTYSVTPVGSENKEKH